MFDMGFNIYAFVKPSNKVEYLALLKEAKRLAEDEDETIEIVMEESDHEHRPSEEEVVEALFGEEARKAFMTPAEPKPEPVQYSYGEVSMTASEWCDCLDVSWEEFYETAQILGSVELAIEEIALDNEEEFENYGGEEDASDV